MDVATSSVEIETLADLVIRLGEIPLHRIRFHPPPGTATEEDVLDIHARTKRLCELVDGVLVEKAMGFLESCLAVEISTILKNHVKPRKLGLVAVESGMMRLTSGLVRIPDVSYIAWDQVPGGRMPAQPIPNLAPTLAVEVLSDSNTPAEMERKRKEYFAAGTRLAWLVDPQTRTVRVYTSPERYTTVKEDETLTGGEVLPEFALPLRDLFAELDTIPYEGQATP